MFKKILSIIACATTLGIVCTGLASCDDEEEIISQQGHILLNGLLMKNYLK